MHLAVKGKQIDVGDSLRTHVADSLNGMIGKYFGNPIEATVVFSREAHLFRADISVHVGRGIVLHSVSNADEPYPAFDTAAEKLAKRLRRHKRRLRDHHHEQARAEEPMPASQYVLRGDGEHPEAEDQGADDQGAGDQNAARGETAHGMNGEAEPPVIVAEMATTIETLTVGEAVMRMDLGDLPALMFRNRAHGGLNMIYRRGDGHVGWVDPKHVATRSPERVA